jgi:LAO/AO transport system kinase
VVQTVATEDRGVEELLAAVDGHRAHLAASASLAHREREQIAIELTDRLRDALLAEALAALPASALAGLVEQVQARELDPQSAVRQLLAALPRR